MRSSRILALLALAVLASSPAAAQEPAGSVTGTVTDSIAGRPLADAAVQLVLSGGQASARTAMSDSLGRFTFTGVADGSYMIGFLHPVLESLGLDQITRAVAVAGGQAARADLATPSPARLKAAYCGAQGEGAVVMGFVRSARGGEPAAGATVLGEWLELAIGRGGVAQQTARRTATTGPNGGFLLCDLPSAGTVLLQVSRGAEGTDRIETEIPSTGFVSRDLFLGEAVAAARPDSTRPDSARAPRTRTGQGQLSGTVIAADGNRPLPDAQVAVVNGAPTRANPRGEWTLSGVPSGTRLVEVRATGYYPVQRVVDIVDGAPPMRVTLTRLATVLDTLTAVARGSRSVARSGFMERRRTASAGRFLTGEDLAKRNMSETSDMADFVPGLSRDRASDALLMRTAFGDPCVPIVYYNGMKMRNLAMSDIDLLARPSDIGAIEIYQETQVPPQFQDAMGGCGSIVIWTK